jgi:hypothetical protein
MHYIYPPPPPTPTPPVCPFRPGACCHLAEAGRLIFLFLAEAVGGGWPPPPYCPPYRPIRALRSYPYRITDTPTQKNRIVKQAIFFLRMGATRAGRNQFTCCLAPPSAFCGCAAGSGANAPSTNTCDLRGRLRARLGGAPVARSCAAFFCLRSRRGDDLHPLRYLLLDLLTASSPEEAEEAVVVAFALRLRCGLSAEDSRPRAGRSRGVYICGRRRSV